MLKPLRRSVIVSSRSLQQNINSQVQNAGADGTVATDQRQFPEIVPADGIRLPFFSEAETSERRRFWAAPGQDSRLDRSTTYHSRAVIPSEIRVQPPRYTGTKGWRQANGLLGLLL
jgi:hypothetical protein